MPSSISPCTLTALFTFLTIFTPTLSDTGSCIDIPLTTDGRCGAEFWTRCPTNPTSCCSNKGSCSLPNTPISELDDYCDIGSQRGFGASWGDSTLNCQGKKAGGGGWTITPCTNLSIAADLRCGEAFGQRCPGNTCCSARGSCSPLNLSTDPSNEDAKNWCDIGCQRAYGKCWGQGVPIVCPVENPDGQITTAACINLKQTTNDRCGPEWNYTRCPQDICCSARGSCQDNGQTNGVEWCGAGCQRGYGKCFGVAISPINCNSLGPPAPPSSNSLLLFPFLYLISLL